MLTYDTLKARPRELLAATGLTAAEFDQLLPAFTAALANTYPAHLTHSGQLRQRRSGGGNKALLATNVDKLLFILVYLKTNPLQTMHGLQFGLSQSQTNYWLHRLLPVVQQALQQLDYMPERNADKLAQHEATDLVIDATERRRQRPADQEQQKQHYSGKKKDHTDKNILLVEQSSSTVIYLGATLAGKTHDKKAADEAAISYPTNATLDKDSGFQGYEPTGVVTRSPKKATRQGTKFSRASAQSSFGK